MKILKATKIWFLLSFLTLATYLAGKLDYSGLIMMGLLILSVLIKGHFIIADFMELRHVRPPWQWAMHGWLIFVTSAIAIAYWIGLST